MDRRTPLGRTWLRRPLLAVTGAAAVTAIAVTGGSGEAAAQLMPTASAAGSPAGSAAGPAAASTTLPAVQPAITEHRINGTRFRADGAVSTPPKVPMRAWAIADMDSGRILAVHAYRRHLPEASTLKLLTAVTAATQVPNRPHRVSYAEAHPAYCTCAGLLPGRWYSRYSLFLGMLLPSGNDAAEALAGADPHGRAAFVRAMNAEARRLGATDTRAVNPSGLTARGAYSSARDLLILLRAAQSNRVVEPFLEKSTGFVGPVRGAKHRVYRGTDYVNHFPTAEGKSGYTTPALNTLVVVTPIRTSAGIRRIGVATLGAPSGHSTRGTRRLTLWAAANDAHLTGVDTLPPAPGPVVGEQAVDVPPSGP